MKKSELSLRDLWDISSGLIYALRELQKDKRQKVAKGLFEKIMAEQLLNLPTHESIDTNPKSSTNSR